MNNGGSGSGCGGGGTESLVTEIRRFIDSMEEALILLANTPDVNAVMLAECENELDTIKQKYERIKARAY